MCEYLSGTSPYSELTPGEGLTVCAMLSAQMVPDVIQPPFTYFFQSHSLTKVGFFLTNKHQRYYKIWSAGHVC